MLRCCTQFVHEGVKVKYLVFFRLSLRFLRFFFRDGPNIDHGIKSLETFLSTTPATGNNLAKLGSSEIRFKEL
jgi:hypothetical protein